MVKYFTRPLMSEERKFTFRSCTEIEARSGLIGCLSVDMPTTFADAKKTWCTVNEAFNSEEFKNEYQEILFVLSSTLSDKESLRVYYNTHLTLTFTESGAHYAGMRVLTEKYCYLVRIKPSGDTDNVSIFCYLHDRLKRHISNAAKGIRFVDRDNHELFTIRDGGRITLYPCTVSTAIICRYIDPFTCKIGKRVWNLKQLAFKAAELGKTIMPA